MSHQNATTIIFYEGVHLQALNIETVLLNNQIKG